MEEQIVSLKVAKLLEEHNFCNGSSHYYSNISLNSYIRMMMEFSILMVWM